MPVVNECRPDWDDVWNFNFATSRFPRILDGSDSIPLGNATVSVSPSCEVVSTLVGAAGTQVQVRLRGFSDGIKYSVECDVNTALGYHHSILGYMKSSARI